MRALNIAARFLAALLLGLSVTFLWVAVNSFLESELRSYGLPNSHAARVAAFVSLLIPFTVPAIPLAAVFRHRAWLAALAIGWMPLATGLFHTSQYQGSVSQSLLVGMAVFEGALYWLALVVGARLASRYWPPTAVGQASTKTPVA
jgi:hypothetical protein